MAIRGGLTAESFPDRTVDSRKKASASSDRVTADELYTPYGLHDNYVDGIYILASRCGPHIVASIVAVDCSLTSAIGYQTP